MADETELDVKIGAQVSGAQDTKALAESVALVADSLRNLASDAKAAVSATDKIERSLAATASGSKMAKKGIDDVTQSLKAQARATSSIKVTDTRAGGGVPPLSATPVPKATSAFDKVTDTRAGSLSNVAQATALFRIERQRSQEIDAQTAKLKQQLAVQEQMYRQANNVAQQAKRNATVPSASGNTVGFADQHLRQIQSYQKGYNEEVKKTTMSVAAAKAQMDGYNDRLANTRYALYGLTNSLGIAGAAILAMNFGIIKSAADFQTYFANIERTSQTSGAELQGLEDQFVKLGQTIPASFSDLSAIETLGGQLGIASEQLTDFTKVTAEFSATTGVAADASATALGRLNQLIPGVNGNFEGLGSSILKVGINSVATEQDIISVSSQIASAGVTAGLTADQIIGFSGAFASLGIKAEAARGTVIRVFGLMGKAVATGGQSLEEFAKVAGVSAEEFSQTWGTSKFSDTFVKFLDGINKQGTKAQLALAGLSITAARDQNNLLKLSQNTDLVNQSLGDASTGFNDASQLGKSFGIIASTVASQAKELWNTLQGLFAELGEGGLGAIGGFLGMLKDMAIAFTELAKNPAVKGILNFIGAVTAAGGVTLLLAAGIGKLVAAVLAGRPVFALLANTLDLIKAKMVVVSRAANVAGVSMNKLQIAAQAAGIGLRSALISTGIGLGLVVAVGAITAAIDTLNTELKSNADTAKDYFGDLSGLSTAIATDTAEATKKYGSLSSVTKSSIGNFKLVHDSVEKVTKSTADWVPAMESATGAQVRTGDATEKTTRTVQEQTFALGDNVKAWYAQQIANDKTFQTLVRNQGKFQAAGLNVTGVLTKMANGDVAGAKRIYDEWQQHGVSAIQETQLAAETGLDQSKFDEAFKAFSGAVETATATNKIFKIASDATGLSVQQLSGDLDDSAESMSGASTSASDLATAISNAFSGTNAISQLAQDFYALSQSIIDGGDNFNVFSTQGQANVSNLESAIGSAITAGQTMGLSATDSVSALFTALQAQGVNTAQLLASLANINIPGVNIGDVGKTVAGTKILSTGAKILAVNLGSVGKQAKTASDALASKGGGGGGGGLGGAANAAAKEVRTLTDYANDLSGVLKRAFDIRFSGQQGMDTITKGWQDIADATADATSKMQDARNTLQQLASDKSIDEYFLGVATAYGDTLRAADIQADLAKNATDTASANKDLANAQSDASKELVGNSKAAIQNRATLTGLVSNYEDYITALAASGADQATLTAKSAELKAQFIQQATQLGFNSAELGTYAVAFDDVHTAIDGVPRNITVDANTNPALQALNEFAAKAKQIASSAGSGAGNSFGSAMGDAVAAAAADAGNRAGLQLKAHFVGSIGQVGYSLVDNLGRKVGGNTFDFYKSGGYTGDASSSSLVGAVHGKEFVVDADNTARLGLPFLKALNNGRTPAVPVAGGGGGGRGGIQLTDLTAGTIAAIADAVSTIVLIGKDQVARASNSANLSGARRGANG